MKTTLRFWLPVGICALFISYVALFKVGNTDFWWHVKAGQILRDAGWISTDPFSYVRAGQPYLAHHEWLAQVLLSVVFDYTGVIGITVLRIAIMLTVFALPVLLHRKHLWFNAILAVIAAAGARPAFTDRPQLFSFMFFSLVTCLCVAYLEGSDRLRKRITWYLPVAVVLWSNLHGAASLTGIAVIGALVVQRLLTGAWRTAERKRLLWCVGALLVAPVLSPSGIGNVTYVFSLFTDKTVGMIAEWQPAAWYIYWQHTAVLWAVSVVALVTTRRNVWFCTLLLVSMGYLSRTAVRHEVLLLIVALTVAVYQLRYNRWWNARLDAFYTRSRAYGLVMAVGLVVLAGYTHVLVYDVNRVGHLFGIGLHEPMKGAYEFIEDQNITGPMFNNYNAGGELLYRGYPDRKVFIDGRNIDYGYTFMRRTIMAGVDRQAWEALVQEYAFTHAVIYYDVQASQSAIAYTDILDADPDWSLVYLDDWSAVYVRHRPDIRPIELVTPYMLHNRVMPEAVNNTQFSTLQAELNHMIDVRPDGIKPRLYLARLYMLIDAFGPAEELLKQAKAQQPHNYVIYVGMAQLHMEREDWPQALYFLKKAERKAGFTGVKLNQELLRTVEQRARG